MPYSLCLRTSVVAMSLWAAGGALADDAAIHKSLDQLYKVGWASSLEARKAFDTARAELPASVAADSRLQYGLLLAYMKQGRYAEATAGAKLLASKRKNDPQLLRAAIWLAVLQKQYPAAMVDMEQLAGRLTPPADETPAKMAQEELARFLGRMYGYLEGPAGGTVAIAEREASRGKVLEMLPEPLRMPFEDAAADVLAQYKAFTGEKKAVQDKALSDAEAERDRKMEELEKQEKTIVARRDELQPRRESIRAELKSELDLLQKQDRPLAARYDALSVQANSVQRDIVLLQSDYNRLEALIRKEKDPVLRDVYEREQRRAEILLFRANDDYNLLDRQASRIVSERQALQRQAATTQAKFTGQLNDVEKELTDLDSTQKRLTGQRLQATKPASGATGKSQVIGAQAAALTTYDVFPLDGEKQKLLDSLVP